MIPQCGDSCVGFSVKNVSLSYFKVFEQVLSRVPTGYINFTRIIEQCPRELTGRFRDTILSPDGLQPKSNDHSKTTYSSHLQPGGRRRRVPSSREVRCAKCSERALFQSDEYREDLQLKRIAVQGISPSTTTPPMQRHMKMTWQMT